MDSSPLTRAATARTVRGLNAEWAALSAAPAARAALDAWRAAEPSLAGYADFEALHAASGHPDGAVRDSLLGGLIRQAQSGRHRAMAARTVLQLMLPWVRAEAARLAYRFEDYDDAVGALCGELLARIRAYPLAARPAKIAANLALDSLQRIAPRRSRARIPPRPVLEIPTAEPRASVPDTAAYAVEGWELAGLLAAALRAGIIDRRDPAVHRRLLSPDAEPDARDELLALLVRAVDARVLTPGQARLTAHSACRDGAGDRAAAAAAGCSLAALRKRRSRTVAQLRAAFGDQARDAAQAA